MSLLSDDEIDTEYSYDWQETVNAEREAGYQAVKGWIAAALVVGVSVLAVWSFLEMPW